MDAWIPREKPDLEVKGNARSFSWCHRKSLFLPRGKVPLQNNAQLPLLSGGMAPGGMGLGHSLDAVSYAKRFTCILSFDLQNGLLRTALQVLRPLCKNAWGC